MTVAYSAAEERMLDSEQEPEMDGVDPWKAAMQVRVQQCGGMDWEQNERCSRRPFLIV